MFAPQLAVMSLLTACGPQVASLRLDGPPEVVTHTLAPLQLAGVTALDADGAPIGEAVAVTWTVVEPAVARLDGTTLTPLSDGTTAIRAAATGVAAEYHLVVSLPDTLALVMPTGLRVGDSPTPLSATVLADGQPVPDAQITWSSDQPEIALVTPEGLLTPVGSGNAQVRATSGELTRSEAVFVAGADPDGSIHRRMMQFLMSGPPAAPKDELWSTLESGPAPEPSTP